MSSFNGTDYFGSGPHSFSVGPSGKQWARWVDIGTADPGIAMLGDHTATVEVRGRLVGASAAALFALADALEGGAGDKGDLVDDLGRTWGGMKLLDVVYDGPPVAGREWSIGYRALFAGL